MPGPVKIITITITPSEFDQILETKLDVKFARIEKLIKEGPYGSAVIQRQEWISQSQLADRLKVTRQTISKWRKTGVIKGCLIGGSWFFDFNEVIRSHIR
ncbi:MAG: helix-turn-helix domain-containing protein [Bacteroidales bacterium]